jgi:RNA polymerase sigma-70 factor (ECF subfamily)
MTRRDESAVGELASRHGDMMFSLALAILHERDDAQEACADALLQAWRTAEHFDPVRCSVPGWLTMITRSRALDRRRARARRGEVGSALRDSAAHVPEDVPSAEDAPDRRAESTERSRLVRQAMVDLPDAQRCVIELAYFGGMSQSEIAEHLRVPLGTVKTRTLAAMKRLRDALAPLLGGEMA